MAEIDRSRTIAATPTEIWTVLSDFGGLSGWVDKIDHSSILSRGPDGEMVGTTRRVQMGRNTVVERVTECDPQFVLAYDIEGLPKFLGRLGNRWTLEATGAGETVVTITSSARIGAGKTQRLVERLACRLVARESDAMLAGLAQRLENRD